MSESTGNAIRDQLAMQTTSDIRGVRRRAKEVLAEFARLDAEIERLRQQPLGTNCSDAWAATFGLDDERDLFIKLERGGDTAYLTIEDSHEDAMLHVLVIKANGDREYGDERVADEALGMLTKVRADPPPNREEYVASTSEQNDLSEARYLLAIFLHAYENDQRMNATHLASAKKLAAPANTRTVAGKE